MVVCAHVHTPGFASERLQNSTEYQVKQYKNDLHNATEVNTLWELLS